jgi:hypothetical protein
MSGMGTKSPKTFAAFALAALSIWAVAGVAAAPAARAGAPARQIAIGMSMLPDKDLNALDQLTASIGGRAPALWSVWSSWGIPNGAFDAPFFDGLRQRNVVPLVIWQPDDPSNPSDPRFAYSRIAAGDWDTYLRDYATAAKAWGGTVIMRFAHEFDGTWFPWGMGRFDNTPATFVAAWQHIVDIFRGPGGVGADNVKFLWSPYGASAPHWPGDAYVDYVGFTRFNWGPPKTSTWRPLKDLLTSAVNNMTAITSKPIIVAETGSSNWSAGNKAAWIRDGYAAAYDNFPSIKAIMYFNITVTGYDWRLTNPPAALQAYADVAADPRFQGSMTTSTVPSGPVVYAKDLFNRTVVNSWGSPPIGGAYTLQSTAANYDVTNGVGTISVGAGSTRSAILTGATARDMDLSFRVATNKIGVGGAQSAYGVARRINATNEYRIRLRMPTNGNALVQAMALVGNVETALGTEVRMPGKHVANAYIRVRAEISGSSPTTIKIRAWPDGTTEPTTWLYSITNSAGALQGAGAVGLRAYVAGATTNGPVLYSFDDFRASDLGGPVPNRAPSATVSLSPSSPTTDQTLTASVSASDPDGNPVSLHYVWKTNGAVRRTLDTGAATDTFDLSGAGNGDPGDTVSVEVTPSDGTLSGATASSSRTVAIPGSVVVYADDAFNRTAVNAWGSANTGGAYTVQSTAADYDVASDVGTMVLAAGGNRSAVLLGASPQDVDLSFRVATDKIAVGGNQFVYGLARRVSATSEYRIKLRLPPNGGVLVQASSVTGNVETALGGEVLVAGLNHAPGSFIRVRAQVVGGNPTTINIRAWVDGTPEPGSWQYSITDSTAGLQAPGPVGLRAYISSATTNGPVLFSFDDLRATSVGP